MFSVAAKNLPSSGWVTLTDTDSCSLGSLERRVLHPISQDTAAPDQLLLQHVREPTLYGSLLTMLQWWGCGAPHALHVYQRGYVQRLRREFAAWPEEERHPLAPARSFKGFARAYEARYAAETSSQIGLPEITHQGVFVTSAMHFDSFPAAL